MILFQNSLLIKARYNFSDKQFKQIKNLANIGSAKIR